MIGIYAALSYKAKENDKILRINDEGFASKTYNSDSATVRLIYPKFKSDTVFHEDNQTWLLMDGEVIENGQYLDATELLCRYNTLGVNSLEGLNGEYFIAVHSDKQLVFISDRMGQRQHCLANDGSKLAIAPNPNEALQIAGIHKKLNMNALYFFMNSKKLRLNRDTIWEKCSVIEPASTLTLSNNVLSVHSYWKLSFRETTPNTNMDMLCKIYRESVNCRVQDGTKKLLTLTGGLDSRTMMCAVEKSKHGDITAITSGMGGCTEIKYAKQVADSLNVKHQPYDLTPEAIFSEQALSYFENEDIDLIIQGQWFPFLDNYSEKDYLLHGLDLDVTIGGIYLTDSLFTLKSEEDLVEYINKEAFIDLQSTKNLFTQEKYEKYHEVVSKCFASTIEECAENTIQETYDHFIMKNSMNRVILQRYRAIRNKIETSSPMYDVNLINFYQRVPIEERRNYKLFHPFMINICGTEAAVPYQRTNLPAHTPVEFWPISQAIESERESLYRQVAEKTNGECFIHFNGYYTNVDEWLRFNKTWKEATFQLLQSEDSILRKNWINSAFVDGIIQEHQAHKKSHMATIVRLMSAEIFLRLEQGVSTRQISESILQAVED